MAPSQIETYLSPNKRSKDVSISTPIGDQLNAIRFKVPSVSETQDPASNESMHPEDQMQATKYSVNDSFLYRALTHELSISISADYKSQKTIEPRHIQLPPKWDTMRLFRVYFKYLGHVQNIIYEPHARTLYRVMLAEAIAVSHSLGLHVVDRVSVRPGHSKVDADPITQEIKRRVWWYLVATDWASSKAEGTSGATYLIQPNLISTSLPRHINDEDLGSSDHKERPLSDPTTMSYNLQRIKVAEVVRCISDLMPHDPSEASCELILTLDAKLESLLYELPNFFNSELAESEETKEIDKAYPHIPMQRLLINLLINIFRCGLHFPYLPGRINKALHAFSRQASLKAARAVLSSQRGMTMTDMLHSADFMKIQGTIFHMFIGALVLTTDICCNQDGQTQISELIEVLKRLDDVKDHSKMAAKLLDILTQLLVSYGVWSPSTTISTYTEDAPSLDFGLLGSESRGLDSLDMPLPFDELWETYIGQPGGLDLLDVLEA
ncbi:hypothetical protein H9Q72_008246 [Fusarium xylarioides]|uniref:Transcription factor domain-containing protein n=1 Tax=Fusarium xylarioides TaxID=221167 RepID=A0A9P7HUU3_9HYPO|nr:hypothetical protein H9Q72_008246 [Fusarium xylarioides]